MPERQFWDKRRRRKRLSRSRNNKLPFYHLLPNMVTLTGLMFGLFGIKWAITQDWESACLAVVICCITDFMDGKLAKILNAPSAIGAQLDSLSDLVCFGVAPSLIAYLYTTHLGHDFLWPFSLIFVMCIALRLARFNTTTDIINGFFYGISSPPAGILILTPVVMHKMLNISWACSPWAYAAFILCISFMVVSSIPTFSLKKTLLPRKWLAPVLIIFCLALTALAVAPWHIFVLFSAGYLGLIPITQIHYRKALSKEDSKNMQLQIPHDTD